MLTKILLLIDEVNVEVHFIELFLVDYDARGLVLLIKLEVGLVLVNLSLKHLDKELKGIADLIGEPHRSVEWAHVKGQLSPRSVVILSQLALNQSLIKLLRNLNSLILIVPLLKDLLNLLKLFRLFGVVL